MNKLLDLAEWVAAAAVAVIFGLFLLSLVFVF